MAHPVTSTSTPLADRTQSGLAFGRLARRPESGSFLGMVAVLLFFGLFGGSGFMSAAGTASWLNIASEIGIIALPIGLLMIAGELDISVGAVIPAASLTAAIVSGHYGLPDWLGITAALGLGLAVGLLNGLLVTRTTIPSLIITIGTMFLTMGLTLGLTVKIAGSTGVSLVPEPLTKAIFGDYLGGMFQVTILWWVVFVIGLFWLLHISPMGNWIYALGGDKESARNVGIPTKRLTIGLFMLSGFSAAFVGVSEVMVYQSAQVLAGQSFIFNSIMCVVIGGVLLTGGFGSIVGIVFGTLTFSIVNQGIYFTSLDPNVGSSIIGALLLIAVLTNDTFRQLALSYSSKKGGRP
ncbi:ABC transporter permease [Mesorhizobium sp. B2-5-13]|nr:ABC transporter permease [Mesorhizobium sp. B2-6-5]TPJ84744.1 ABC transporter permease [Mesorhizobium sp. B2-5-13]TPK50890.1 ABC transporter permease [Mesorhizobium sp. B2-5-5]